MEKESASLLRRPSFPTVHVEQTLWVELKPRRESLIEETLADYNVEERMITFQRAVADSDSHLLISNLSKKSEEVRDYPYKPFGGKKAGGHLFNDVFFELIAKAGLNKDDFEKGKWGYQDQLYVKEISIDTNNLPIDNAIEYIRKEILSRLRKVSQPYLVFVISLGDHAAYTINDVVSCDDWTNFKTKEKIPIGAIYLHEANQIYILYNNDFCPTLDLHDMSVDEAKEKVTKFIVEKFDHFEPKCEIITGRGNHSLGNYCILKALLPSWLNSPELRPLIRKHFFDKNKGGGTCTILLVESPLIVLNGTNQQGNIEIVMESILAESERGGCRLSFSLKDEAQNRDVIIMLALSQLPKSDKWPVFYFRKLNGQLIWGRVPSSSGDRNFLAEFVCIS